MPDDRIRPHVLMMSEITADGKLTLKRGASSKRLMKFMAPETEVLLHETRATCDAIMVGSNTIRIDNSFLTVRYIEGKSPIRVIPSSDASLPPDANVLKPDAPTVIAVSARAPADRVAALRAAGADVVVAGDERVDLPLLMQRLVEEYGVRRMMVEGGPTLNWHMLHHRLVDEIRLIHLPFIVGGEDTPSLVGGMRIDSEEEMIRLSLKSPLPLRHEPRDRVQRGLSLDHAERVGLHELAADGGRVAAGAQAEREAHGSAVDRDVDPRGEPDGANRTRERGADDRCRTPETALVHAVRGHQPSCQGVGLAELGKRLAPGHRDPDCSPAPRHQLSRRAEGAVRDHVDAAVGEDEAGRRARPHRAAPRGRFAPKGRG